MSIGQRIGVCLFVCLAIGQSVAAQEPVRRLWQVVARVETDQGAVVTSGLHQPSDVATLSGEVVPTVRWERLSARGWETMRRWNLRLPDGRVIHVTPHSTAAAAAPSLPDCATRYYRLTGTSPEGLTVTGQGRVCIENATGIPRAHVGTLALAGTMAAPWRISIAAMEVAR